ncbi:VWA domain-containing protein [Virgibacillus sp. MSJ-26]|uniref:vWA domain-containing protein n=1 Tax=Virgibacillus sp. MSJ-26 TaxID=2841522 RepID=UPI001C108F12|nr:VWA domain-containing protein [Virgibacillus sp. MSJ-26]MBU5468495.1 VWA domain-containing protein [Virgibacillus sp. MSJ-26]
MYRFHDKKIDTDLFLQLQDLTTVLSREPDLHFDFSYGSYLDVTDNKVTASTFWDQNDSNLKVAGYKTDIYLRTLGNLHYTAIQPLRNFMDDYFNESTLPRFTSQLVTFFENFRLEELIKKDRPGTVTLFKKRNEYLKFYFTNQLKTNVTKGYAIDELFCLIFLLVQADQPDPQFPQADEKQLHQLEQLKPAIYSLFEVKATEDILRLVEQIVARLINTYQDSMNDYFIFPIAHINIYTRNNLFDELTRTDPLANDDLEEVDKEKSDYIDETFSTWHRENKNEDRKQTFLQFDLEQGTKTDLLGGGTRETEEGDQAMASIQGASGESEQKDYSKLDTLEKKESKQAGHQSESPFGEENKHAVAIVKHAEVPTEQDKHDYDEVVLDIDSMRRKLAKTIENTLEHKQTEPRDGLAMGRLSKNLLPLVFEDNPRIFYKKDHQSKEIDAVFTLLVDCSASMHNKMDQTKRGIVLFHEVLSQLNIPHSIVGFWEDATHTKDNYQPNYFHTIHSFTDSLYQKNGAKIMQLEPQEDNRDGFSIRMMTKELEARRESNKFLLIFSDGEPAAMDYEENGIVDTHQAVLEARKKGIDVIGMFLANNEIAENEDATMKNIYGTQRAMVPNVEELPEQFAPLLKKLILKTL